MPLSCWRLAAALFFSFPVYASSSEQNSGQNSLLWFFYLAATLLLLTLLSLLLYNRKLARNNRKLAEQQLMFSTFLQNHQNIACILNQQFDVEYASHSLLQLLETTEQQRPDIRLYQDEQCRHPASPQLLQQHFWQGQLWLKIANHPAQPIQLTITALFPSETAGKRYLAVAQSQPEQQHNNTLLNETLSCLHQVIQSCNEDYPVCALLLISFMPKSDTVPKTTDADEYQHQLAEQLHSLLPAGALLTPYDKAHFAVILPPHLCSGQLEINLNRLALRIETDTGLSSAGLPPLVVHTAICQFPDDGKTAGMLLKNAVATLNIDSQYGHSTIRFASSKMQIRAPEYQALENELFKGFSGNEFDVYFQPRMSIASNRIVGYEALLRWHSPKRGILLPQSFIQMADETGLLGKLDRLAFRKCCEQLQYWRHTGLARGRISLNVSAQSLQQADFPDFLYSQLQQNELTADGFELELSENILLHASPSIRQRLAQLSKQGFHLTIDNFGQGALSLTLLQQLPLNSIKIAQQLIRDIEHNERQRNITASLIRIATYLQLDVIATGIENEMQAYLLHVMGCDVLQGHLFSKALPASEIPAVLARENNLLRKEVS
ncbi:EAL domain-containing protein [Chromatiaceae bacterium AAb-1]|nr:EAL domain-containing protein [Chromatiaceae bacterium AAb-1]